MLTDLAKRVDLLVVVIPHQKFAFHNICTLEFALRSADGQTCHDGSVDAGLISCRVSTTLREDLDFRAGFDQTDMDLTILAVVFLFNAYSSPSDQLAAVCDTSGFITAGQAHCDAGPRFKIIGC
jgi:hypothetical protein